MSTYRLPVCSTSCPGPCPRTSAEGEYTRRNSKGSSKRLPSENTISSTRDFWCSVMPVGVRASAAMARVPAASGSGRLEADALEVGAAIDQLGEPHAAGPVGDLHLALGLEPAHGNDQRLGRLQRGERRKQEALGERLGRVRTRGLDGDALRNPGKNLHAYAQGELGRHRQPPDRAQQDRLAVRELDSQQLIEHHPGAAPGLDALEAQSRGAFVPDLPGLELDIRRGRRLVVARCKATERGDLHVLFRRYRPRAGADLEPAARNRLVDRRLADALFAGPPAPWRG